MKECGRCHNWFHKVCEDFNCKDQISEVNSENQWFCCYCIGIHRLPYKLSDNIFVNHCLENEEMHSIIAQECKKWRRHIDREFVKKLNFEWLVKEFKANESFDENKRKYRIPFSIVRCFDFDRRHK